ncbi:hypothetical protein LYNGBM3L_74950 [Moorena producens 3L]|uniref:Uncharacterized protein n=1 Tax=Moorena producens 3L TaxID=489825 RepID=F4Y421_9CYAN|nr:hypothetical protein LYNGBM3L_74950 [Moorena producens 3L]
MHKIWTKTKAPSWVLACCDSTYSNPQSFFPSAKYQFFAGEGL